VTGAGPNDLLHRAHAQNGLPYIILAADVPRVSRQNNFKRLSDVVFKRSVHIIVLKLRSLLNSKISAMSK